MKQKRTVHEAMATVEKTVRENILGITSDEGPICPYCRTIHAAGPGDDYANDVEDGCTSRCAKCKREYLCVATRWVTWEGRPVTT